MKNKIKKLLPILFVAISFNSCNKDDETCTTDISNELKSIETLYGCENTVVTLQLDEFAEYKIIETSVQYDAIVSGDCHPAIDFDKYYLIIGNVPSDKKIVSFDYKLYDSCEPNFFKLNVRIKKDETLIGNSYNTFHVLMPKEKDIQSFEVFYTVLK